MLLSESVRAPLNPGETRRQVPSQVDAAALARGRDLAYSQATMIQLEPTHTDKHPELGTLLWTLDGHYVVGLAFSQEAPPARIDYDDAESDEPQPCLVIRPALTPSTLFSLEMSGRCVVYPIVSAGPLPVCSLANSGKHSAWDHHELRRNRPRA